MNSKYDIKFTGINGWFIIEILSFYGYIMSAAVFILGTQIKSSLGYVDKINTPLSEVYKYDFVAYYRKDLDWLAFVTILFNVNIGLILID